MSSIHSDDVIGQKRVGLIPIFDSKKMHPAPEPQILVCDTPSEDSIENRVIQEGSLLDQSVQRLDGFMQVFFVREIGAASQLYAATDVGRTDVMHGRGRSRVHLCGRAHLAQERDTFNP